MALGTGGVVARQFCRGMTAAAGVVCYCGSLIYMEGLFFSFASY